MESMAERICKRFEQLSSDRGNWESHWHEIAERVLPRQDEFQRQHTTEGEKRTERIFDSTAVLALDRAASAIDSLITPTSQQYHRLIPEDDRLIYDRDVMVYLEEVNKMLFRMRYRPKANFSSQAHECYVSLMAFGTLGMFVDEQIGIGTRYKSVPLSGMYISENYVGMVDYVIYKFQLTARAAIQKWGNRVPEKIAKMADSNPFQKFDFIHCVMPNENIVPGARDYRGMAWSSYYIALDGKAMLSEGGYRSMPYMVSRHVTAPDETYGRSPAMQVLADIKMVNEMDKTTIRAAHKIVDPPLLVYGDGVLGVMSTRPGAMNYGGVDEQGRQLIQPLKMGSNLPIAIELTEQKRKVINDAFYVTLFQILVQNPQMTATEALIRSQEKGQLLAPTVGRQQSEFLGPLIERELDILAMSGALPPMPESLAMSGGAVKAEYTSPLTRLRRAEDGVAIMRTIEALTPIAQVRPQVMDVFKDDELAFELAEINGVPAKILRSPAELEALRQKQEEDAADAADAKNAQLAASAAKNAGQAVQAVQGVTGV